MECRVLAVLPHRQRRRTPDVDVLNHRSGVSIRTRRDTIVSCCASKTTLLTRGKPSGDACQSDLPLMACLGESATGKCAQSVQATREGVGIVGVGVGCTFRKSRQSPVCRAGDPRGRGSGRRNRSCGAGFGPGHHRTGTLPGEHAMSSGRRRTGVGLLPDGGRGDNMPTVPGRGITNRGRTAASPAGASSGWHPGGP